MSKDVNIIRILFDVRLFLGNKKFGFLMFRDSCKGFFLIILCLGI